MTKIASVQYATARLNPYPAKLYYLSTISGDTTTCSSLVAVIHTQSSVIVSSSQSWCSTATVILSCWSAPFPADVGHGSARLQAEEAGEYQL
jgi:hypothetical protein